MKKLKILFFTAILLFSFTACTNDEAITNVPNVNESASLQRVLEELDIHVDENGDLIPTENPTGNIIFDFCFEFVYPLELVYNTGTTVTVENFTDLITIILNETPELYIVGIEFPFDVEIYNPATNQIETLTITNETEFAALLDSCDIGNSCPCPSDYDPVCVEIIQNGVTVVITFPNACHAECAGFTPNQYFPCTGCGCPTTFDPVCVLDNNGNLIQFNNECLAMCEGYTPNQFVPCEADECEISNLNVVVGDCNVDGTYSLTIDFDYDNPGNDFFDVYVRNGDLLGFYPLSDLPLTIENFEMSGLNLDYVQVCINDNPNCCEEIEWLSPNCNNGNCDISNLTVDIGACNPATGNYAITIDFDYVNPGNDFFDVYVRNGDLLGFYSLSDLPLTIENFEFSGLSTDYVKVCINDNPDCCEELEWVPPSCDNCNCPNVYDPVCVDINGTLITYFNACYAECDGFTDFVTCVDQCNSCINEPYDPICVELSNGTIVTMYNECFLFCNGFTPNNVVTCN